MFVGGVRASDRVGGNTTGSLVGGGGANGAGAVLSGVVETDVGGGKTGSGAVGTGASVAAAVVGGTSNVGDDTFVRGGAAVMVGASGGWNSGNVVDGGDNGAAGGVVTVGEVKGCTGVWGARVCSAGACSDGVCGAAGGSEPSVAMRRPPVVGAVSGGVLLRLARGIGARGCSGAAEAVKAGPRTAGAIVASGGFGFVTEGATANGAIGGIDCDGMVSVEVGAPGVEVGCCEATVGSVGGCNGDGVGAGLRICSCDACPPSVDVLAPGFDVDGGAPYVGALGGGVGRFVSPMRSVLRGGTTGGAP